MNKRTFLKGLLALPAIFSVPVGAKPVRYYPGTELKFKPQHTNTGSSMSYLELAERVREEAGLNEAPRFYGESIPSLMRKHQAEMNKRWREDMDFYHASN